MKRILPSLIVTVALFLGLVGLQPVRAADAVTLTANGWSLPVGSWDPATGTAILEQDVAGITIVPTGLTALTVEGGGGRVIGTGSGYGVTINSSWDVPVRVRNLAIQGFSRGIYVSFSDSITLEGNSISSCGYGIYVEYSPGTVLIGNTASASANHGIFLKNSAGSTLIANTAQANSYDGIHLQLSDNSTLTGNTCALNRSHGLYINRSGRSVLSGNTMSGNRWGFRLDGASDWEYEQTIDTTNTVGGKPILYLMGVTGGTYGSATNASAVYLIKCNGVTVKDLTLGQNHVGVLLWKTHGSRLENLQVSGTTHGIWLRNSRSNVLAGNTVSGSSYAGIYLQASNDGSGEISTDNNLLQGNTIQGSESFGLYLNGATANTIYGNTFLSNYSQAYGYLASGNVFNLPAPTGGNYWSNWTGPDADGDGFVDSPYIFTGGRDDLPLAKPPTGDSTPPTTTASLSGVPGNDGWYRSDVQVTLSATDEGSGVAGTSYRLNGADWQSYLAPFTVTAEGNTIVEFRSVDRAGNVEPAQSVLLRVDKTAPALTQGAVEGTAGRDGWYLSDVAVAFAAEDAVSGLADPAGAALTLVASGEGEAVATGSQEVYDVAGNVAVAGPLTFKIDRTAPVVVGTPTTQANASGWYNADVTIRWTASDAVSGVDPATLPPDSVIVGEGTGLCAGPVTVSDLAGNTSAPAMVSGIQIDRTPPVVTIISPEPYAVLPVGAALHFEATDALSGVGSVVATLNNGQVTIPVLDGFAPQPGVYTLVVEATDLAGNRASDSREFVIYDPSSGFVTGGGWLTSVAGAYLPNPSLTGKVSFGFVSKYGKGLEPAGQLEFRFEAAGLTFHSTSYDRLQVAGSKGVFKGSGTINGAGSYGFEVTAVDGTPDRFRLVIWDSTTGATLYDNGLGTGAMGASTYLQGGSVIVHK